MSKLDPAVYRIVNPITNDCYVGSSSYVLSRKSAHFQMLRRNVHENAHLQAAWNKYGEESFSFEILERCEKPNCIEREQYWIDTLQPAYNIRKQASHSGIDFLNSVEARKNGGKQPSRGWEKSPEAVEKSRQANLGRTLSDDHREKIRQAHLGTKASPETIEKLRQSHLGQKPTAEATEKNRQAQLGRTLSPEAREKIRQSKLGKKRSPELREKLRQANLGKKQSPETIRKRTQNPVSDETKQKLREARQASDAAGKPHGGPSKGTVYKKKAAQDDSSSG